MSFRIGNTPADFFMLKDNIKSSNSTSQPAESSKSKSENSNKKNQFLEGLFTSEQHKKNHFYVSVKNTETKEKIFSKVYTDFKTFQEESYKYQTKEPIDKLIFVGRMDSVRHFTADLFIPTTQEVTSTKKISTLAGAILLDLVTLLFRVVTLPYRAWTIQTAKTHPLYQDIKHSIPASGALPPLAVFISTDRLTDNNETQVAKLGYAFPLVDSFNENDIPIYFSKNEEYEDPEFRKFFDNHFNFETPVSETATEALNKAYGYFGVNKETPWNEILKKYKELALKLHPDKDLNNPKAQENFKTLNEHMQAIKVARGK